MRPALLLLLPLAVYAASDLTVTRHRDLLLITAPADRQSMPAGLHSVPMTVDFADTPIDDVAELIARATGANVVVDPVLRANGTTVTLRVHTMAAGNVFAWIEQVANIHISWVDRALYFSAEPPRRPQVTRAYDVADLVLRVPDFPGPELAMTADERGAIFVPSVERVDQTPIHDDLIALIEGVLAGR